ncbi:MAG: hypothetical protein M0Z87_03010 [Actinomycetota bacterium]|nr:hypothetical protein [Actinomycetota bacterium]
MPWTNPASPPVSTSVSISNQPSVNVANSPGVAVINAPDVGVPGGVAVTNSPNVGVPGGVGVTGGQLMNSSGYAVQPSTDQITSADLGNGTDGAVTLTTNTVLARTMNWSGLTINAGVTLSPSGWLMRCTGTIDNAGVVDNSGPSGTSNGTAAAPGAVLGGGGNGGVMFGGNGSQNGFSAPSANIAGGGGGTASATYAGTTYTGTGGSEPANPPAFALSLQILRTNTFAGGAGGGAATNASTTVTTDGGSGGGCIVAIADTFSGNGTWSANGADAYIESTTTVVEAGGGGGGGLLFLVCLNYQASYVLQANGGNGAVVDNPNAPGSANPGQPGAAQVLVTQ